MFTIPKDKELSLYEIAEYVKIAEAESERLNKLFNYYNAKQDILNKTVSNSYKPNNRLVHNYPSYITDSYTGYFMGTPVSYTAKNSKDGKLEILQGIFDSNDEQNENAELEKNASIFGVAYEILYTDIYGNPKFKHIKTSGCLSIYDDTLEAETMYFIRYYDVMKNVVTKETERIVEVYDRSKQAVYKDVGLNLELLSEKPHYFDGVPVVEYRNNEECTGDFEKVI